MPIMISSSVRFFFHVGEQNIVRWCQIRRMWRVINQFKVPGPNFHRTSGYIKIMLVPHHLNPPNSGKGYIPLSRVLVSIGITKKEIRAVSVNLPETTVKRYPLFRENGNTHAAPSCIRVGGGFKVTVTNSSYCNHRLVCRSIVLERQNSFRQFSKPSPKCL